MSEDDIRISIKEGDLMIFLFDVLWMIFAVQVLILCKVIEYFGTFAPTDVDGSVYILLDIAGLISKTVVILFIAVNLRWAWKKFVSAIVHYYRKDL